MMFLDIKLKVWGITWRIWVGWDMRITVFERWEKRKYVMEGILLLLICQVQDRILEFLNFFGIDISIGGIVWAMNRIVCG